MNAAPSYAIIYDVTDDRERTRVAKILIGYGFRVQKSVFECKLSRGDRKSLVARLEALALQTGSVKLYRIHSRAEHTVIGKPMVDPDEAAIFAF